MVAENALIVHFSARLLLVHFDCVALFHFQGGGCVVLINRLSIEAKSNNLHRQTLQEHRYIQLKYTSFI